MADDKTYTQEDLDAKVAEFQDQLEEAKAKVAEFRQTNVDLMKKFDGIDPAEHKQLRDRLTELEHQKKADKAGITAEELQKMRAEIRQDLEEEFAEHRTRAESLAQENRELKLDNVVKAQMGKAGVRSERLDALFTLTSGHYDLTEDGQPIVTKRPGKEVDKYIAEDLAKEYPEFFNGSGSSGGGASRSAAGGSGAAEVAAGDNDAFLANLDGIASGEVVLSE